METGCPDLGCVWSRRIIWVGYVSRRGEMKNEYKISVESLKQRDHLEDLCFYSRIIINWILREIGWEGMGRVQFWALLNTVMDLWVP
jgi:hypothetical protein